MNALLISIQRVLGFFGLALLALPVVIGDAHADTNRLDKEASFEIPAQSLSTALVQFSKQAGLQLVTASTEVDSRNTRGVSGRLTLRRALDELLDRTGLGYSLVGENTVAILLPSKSGVTDTAAGADVSQSGVMHLVQSAGDANTNSQPSADRQNSASPNTPGRRDSAVEESAANATEEELIVTGSHIRGTTNNTAPLTVLDRAYIDSTGISTAARLIESLPQNFALTSQSAVIVPGSNSSKVQGASVNLRGIGEGTTLVLLNGRRMALGFLGTGADISSLPLTVVERVEVLTDGASAVYGSDAVGGVVNFVLQSDFSGMETRMRAGWADGGVNEYRLSQALGHAWGSGNALVSLEYYKRDLLLASKRDFVPNGAQVGSLYPRDRNYSVLFSGHQEFTDAFGAYADLLYIDRDSYNIGFLARNEDTMSENPQSSATVGLNWQVANDWQIDLSGSYARNKLHQSSDSTLNGTNGALINDVVFDTRGAEIKADGPLWRLPGGMARAAFGVDARSESIEFASHFTNSNANTGNPGDFDQSVRSAFAEIYLPLVDGDRTGMKHLELSLAGRYDDYSRFGSSFDPRFGFSWQPTNALRIRGSYGTSYVAPKLADYNLTSTRGFALVQPDPLGAGGVSRQFLLLGTDVSSLGPQESESGSLGFEVTPTSLPGVRFGLNYYTIEYSNRIAAAQPTTVILANPASFSSLFIRSPTQQQISQYIAIAQQGGNPVIALVDPTTVVAIVDGRRRNLSVTETNGMDLSAQYAFDVGTNAFKLGLNATYILEMVQQATETSAPFDSLDTIYNPVNLRLRASLGWNSLGWSANFFVNHTDSYVDNRTTLTKPISSYTTVDARLAYNIGERTSSSFWSGTTMAVSTQNLFDREPPFAAIIRTDADMGFDPTNADPMGRLVAIEISKQW